MNENDRRLWDHMIELIHEFEEGKILYHRMVDQLEAALDEGDFKESEVVRGWYEVWSPLEELDEESSHDLEIDREAIHPFLEKMKSYLWDQKKVWAPSQPPHPHHQHPPKSAAAGH